MDGGYDQADAEALAHILAGWTVGVAGGPLDRLLGQLFPDSGGVAPVSGLMA